MASKPIQRRPTVRLRIVGRIRPVRSHWGKAKLSCEQGEEIVYERRVRPYRCVDRRRLRRSWSISHRTPWIDDAEAFLCPPEERVSAPHAPAKQLCEFADTQIVDIAKDQGRALHVR